MFQATHRFGLFDYLRTPYQIDPDLSLLPGLPPIFGRLRVPGRDLVYPRAPMRGLVPGRYTIEDVTFFGHVLPDSQVARWMSGWGSGWRRTNAVTNEKGEPSAGVWRDKAGNVFLPFDPGEVMELFWSEGYQTLGGSGSRRIKHALRQGVVKSYYAVRPLLPRAMQIALRQRFTKVQQRNSFPAWPIDTSSMDFCTLVLEILGAFAGRPVPWLAVWPAGYRSALVLTHDVETADGLARVDVLRDLERPLGLKSSWNFVPLRYETPLSVLDSLRAEGCEIGVHGLLHDGRDLGSRRLMRKRLPQIRSYAAKWRAVGFRSPATQRVWEWMPSLGFEYDTSYHDTAPYEPRPGGCCGFLPYENKDLVELPITLPMDHTLFEILQQPDETVWLEKSELIRRRNGMVLVLTHPDYSIDPRVVEGYGRLLKSYEGDETVWRALPREVASWWRRRSASTIETTTDGSHVVRGPAADEAEIRLQEGPVQK